jgi:leader peptidase (prepilin peptidase)/N-methyltransferase
MDSESLSILTDALFISLLVWCSYTDLKRRIVSNIAIVILLCLGVAHYITVLYTGLEWSRYPAALLVAIPFFIAWLKGKMGAGDVKLIIAAGLYLGLANIMIAFLLMVPLLIVLMIFSVTKGKQKKHLIPLAPVIAFGGIGTLILRYFLN